MHVSIGQLITAFTRSGPAETESAYRALLEALWNDDEPLPAASSAVPQLLTVLPQSGPKVRGRLLVLLGVLAHTGGREEFGAVNEAVRAGVPGYLQLLQTVGGRHRDTAPLLYLLSQFPTDREAILAATSGLDLDDGDRSRLERALRLLDPSDPEPDLARVWPSPSVWQLDEAEQAFDRGWIAGLSPEQVKVGWQYDTETMLAYSGAKAVWASRTGEYVEESTQFIVPADVPETAGDPGPAIFDQHLMALRCPACLSTLARIDTEVQCDGCGLGYPVGGGVLDLTVGNRVTGDAAGTEQSAGLLNKLAEMPSMGLYYESILRAAFLRIAGSNWGGTISPDGEDDYLATHVAPVAGPILDLAAGTGRWTSVLARTHGADRVIAVDTGIAMLSVLRRRLVDVPAVIGSALDLPFGAATLGAVSCWNALQAFPEDAAAAIAEIGRCLRPGGTFTAMTFVWDEDPLARFFQRTHHFPSRPAGMLLFERDELSRWVKEAGMSIQDLSGPDGFVLLTAVKDA